VDCVSWIGWLCYHSFPDIPIWWSMMFITYSTPRPVTIFVSNQLVYTLSFLIPDSPAYVDVDGRCRVVSWCVWSLSLEIDEIDISYTGPDQSVFQPNPSNRKFLTASSSTSLSLYNRRLEDWKKRREDITIYPLPSHCSCQGDI